MRRTALRRSPMKRRYRATGPTFDVVAAVVKRDGGLCAYCAFVVLGESGAAWSLHHRRPRRMGGDRRPETNGAANLVLLHGTGTTGCHGEVESNRTKSLASGLLLHAGDIPAEKPIDHAAHGRVYLTDDFGWTRAGEVS